MTHNEICIASMERGFEKGGGLPGCRITLSSGESFFILLSHADDLKLESGQTVSMGLREELHRGTLRREVSLKALDLLALRDHSRLELERKLTKRFLPREIREESDGDAGEGGSSLIPAVFIRECIEGALDALTTKGYLNDRRFAEQWVFSRLRKRPEGRGALETGLRSKGVSRQIAAEVLTRAFTPETERDALSRAGEKLARKTGITREKLTSRLLSRGFSYRQVKDWIETHGEGLFKNQED